MFGAYDTIGNILGVSTAFPHPAVVSFGVGRQRQYQFMTAPTGTTLPTYQQAYSYDSLDRITSGDKGTVSYSDTNHVHAATTLGSLPNPYASYDAMGDMTCRNIDTSTAHTCTSGSANGASMTYDAEGRMDSWTAPSGTTANDKFLYDNEGNRVLQRTSTTSGGTTTVTDDITFDGYTEVTISGGTTATAKYYSANGQRVAMRVNGILSYLLSDNLGSSTVALNSDGSGQAVQLFSPYGSARYSWGSMPTTYNFTGQRLDSLTGLLYYGFRYYDPFSGRFTRADTEENNTSGIDPYTYVRDNPETKNDPTGHTGGDPYLQYIYAWYVSFHPGDNVYGDVLGRQLRLPNSKVPEGSPSKWPSPSVGTNGDGKPDIANQSLHVIWEVKSGGEKGFYATGSRFAGKRTRYYADATAQWYADRASIVLGTPWSPGDPGILGNDPAVGVYFDAFCGGLTGTCYYEIPGGRTLAIQLVLTARGRPVTGVFTYRVIPPEEVYRPIPVFALSPEAVVYAWRLLNEGNGQPQPGGGVVVNYGNQLDPFGLGNAGCNLCKLLYLNG